MKSIYEQVGGTYTRQGDYELPNLKVSLEKEIEIGVWGQRCRRYLKQYHKVRYYNLLTAGKLILSRLVDTFISKISLTMLPVPKPHNTACVLSWEEARRWQSRSSGYSSS